MAVDMGDELVGLVQVEANPPGFNLYPSATDDIWLNNLRNGFYDLKLYGLITGYEENVGARGGDEDFSEGIITPIGIDPDYDGSDHEFVDGTDLDRDSQQLLIMWAAYKAMLLRVTALKGVFRAKAGPVEYETQQAATVLVEALKQKKEMLQFIIGRMSTLTANTVSVFDAYIERTYYQAVGDESWLR